MGYCVASVWVCIIKHGLVGPFWVEDEFKCIFKTYCQVLAEIVTGLNKSSYRSMFVDENLFSNT